jgi:hypothetical protein
MNVMNLKGLINKGKKIVDERGGVESLKADAQEVAKIAKGKGSLSDKAKEAAAAIKDPGANAPDPQEANQPEPQERHPNRHATEERQADANRQESKERRHP